MAATTSMSGVKAFTCAAFVLALFAVLAACSTPAKFDSSAMATPTATVSPSPSTAGTPSGLRFRTPAERRTPDPTPSPGPAMQVAALEYVSAAIDDGIEPGEYPPLAPSPGDGFPEAYQMEDWVWDLAGERWSVAVVTGNLWGVRQGEVYLVSPEGAYFDLLPLEPKYSSGAAVVTWRESERVATVTWNVNGSWDGNRAGELNLETGVMDPMEFQMKGGLTENVVFVAGNADGVEMWEARDYTQIRYLRWTPGGEYEAVLDEQTNIRTEHQHASPDGELVLFYLVQGDADPEGHRGADDHPRYFMYSLATSKFWVLGPAWPSDAQECSAHRWLAPGSLGGGCLSSDLATEGVYLVVDAVTGAVSEPPANPPGSVGYSLEGIDGLARVTFPNGVVLLRTPSHNVIGVAVTTADGMVTVADGTNLLSDGGGYLLAARDLGNGALRLDLGRAILVIDTQSGEMVILGRARTASGEREIWTSLAFHGESATEGLDGGHFQVSP